MGEKKLTCSIILIALILIVISCQKDEKPPDPVTDIEGNSYNTILIGNQVWMAENLHTTKFNDGTDIELVTDAVKWRDISTPGYCWYNNEEAKYKDPYGALYNGYSVTSGKLCPVGWHLPDTAEIHELITFSGDSLIAGGKMKEAGTTHWLSPNKGADNSTGFTAVAAGIRYFEGTFTSVLSYTGFWLATEIGDNDNWYMSLYFGDAVVTLNHKSKNHGFSVRCIRD